MSEELHFTNPVTPDRDPDQSTALALLKAYGLADVEGVETIVNTTDPARLSAVLTGLAYELVLVLYRGDPERADAGLEHWLQTGHPLPLD